MSRFVLVPVDGGEPVHVPPGETVLGRGPFLQVGDRRVSRHHGLLENLDGRLRLKPTHLNPCFTQPTLCHDPQPLQKDEWHTLRHGDFFSLLPGHLIFQVEVVDEPPPFPRNSQMFEEQQRGAAPPAAGGGEQEQTPLTAPTSEEALSTPSPKQGEERSRGAQEEVNVAPTPPRSRVLPTWMMAAATAASQKPAFSPKGQKHNASAAPAGRKPVQATPTNTSTTPEEARPGPEERPRKRRRSPKKQPPQTKSDSRPATSSLRSEDEDDAAHSPAGSVSVTGPSSGAVQVRQTRKRSQDPPALASSSAAGVRTPCQYGKDCYRKNPLHFQECSHPGDSDYQEEEDLQEEERPECPFGTDCYRKNPLHRKEYKHTKRPGAPPTRAVAKRSYRDDGDEEEDEDESDDSFIDDESVDGGDDSDYVPPPDSDESVREDSQRLREEAQSLRQEAQDFLKRSK